MNVVNALRVGSVTCLGIIDKTFPIEYGNCFAVGIGQGKWYSIVNFKHENLEELLFRKVISWPIKISPIDEHRAVIFDERIPDEWYSRRWCETCCPEELLPIPQQHIHRLQELRGDRTVSTVTLGNEKMQIVSLNIKAKPGIIKTKWKIKYEDPIVIINEGAVEKWGKRYSEKKINKDFYKEIRINGNTAE